MLRYIYITHVMNGIYIYIQYFALISSVIDLNNGSLNYLASRSAHIFHISAHKLTSLLDPLNP